jgi:alpha-tubulin suppressor-like RCC1 family protein
MTGVISQNGEVIMDSHNYNHSLINLSDWCRGGDGSGKGDKKQESFPKIKEIRCGYSHACLLSEDGFVFSFGANACGQLGIGEHELFARYPVSVATINDSLDPVLLIACGANFSVCYTELGIVYYWGMMIVDDRESI